MTGGGTSRRRVLGAALLASAFAGRRAGAALKNAPRRIDVHQHIVPPLWADAMRGPGGNIFKDPVPDWSPETAIDFMDMQGIATGILSLTSPGVTIWQGARRVDRTRAINAYCADVVQRRPDRFGLFATLPLPDIDASLAEVAHAFDTLHADGVVILSNYDGRYLGDPLFDPLWAELARRDAVVFIHPHRPPMAEVPGMPGPFVDFPFDTTRTAVDMVLRGVLDRHRQLRVILAHGGGFLPYAAHRFAEVSATFRPGSPDAGSLLDTLRRFYFDTALTASPASLPSLTAFADPARILYGSDFPYAPARLAGTFTAHLDASTILSPQDHRAIDNRNAQALFPRLKP